MNDTTEWLSWADGDVPETGMRALVYCKGLGEIPARCVHPGGIHVSGDLVQEWPVFIIEKTGERLKTGFYKPIEAPVAQPVEQPTRNG